MDFDVNIEVPHITSPSLCSTKPFKQDDRKIQAELVGQLELLSSIFTKAELESQNKLLSVIIYKHSNQLRKHKTLQYAKRIFKMVGRLESNFVKDYIIEFRLHIDNACKCIWSKANEVSCSEKKAELINGMLCKVRIIIEALRSCSSALPWVIADLKLKVFIAFNTFLLSHFSRVRVVLLRIFEEFADVFYLMKKLDLVTEVMLDQVISAKHEFLSKHGSYKDVKDAAAVQKNVPNMLLSCKNEVKMDFCTKLVLSDEGLIVSNSTEKHFALEDGNYGGTGSDFFINNKVMRKSDAYDIGVSIPRKNTKDSQDAAKSDSIDRSHAYWDGKKKYFSVRTSSKVITQKKVKSKPVSTFCCCWKCQRNRKYFHLENGIKICNNKYGFKCIATKHSVISKTISVRRKKRRKTTLTNDVQKEYEISHQEDGGHSTIFPPFISRNFFEPKLSSTKLDDIDMIFDVL